MIFYNLIFVLFCSLVTARLLPTQVHEKSNNLLFESHTVKDFAQKTSLVDLLSGIKFQTGYIQVGRTGGQLFYFLLPSDQKTGELSKDPSKPYAFWFTGGPGCSSMLALFTENGPINVFPNGDVALNPYSWHALADIIYIDQPMGTGFSDAGSACNYANDEHDISLYMTEFFQKFLYRYPILHNKPLYLLGESYAGHYIPSIAEYLIKYPILYMNLAGIAIGNGWVKPTDTWKSYPEFAHANNLIDDKEYKAFKKETEICFKLVDMHMPIPAAILCETVFRNILKDKNPYDIRLQCEVPPLCYNDTALISYMNDEAVQAKLEVSHKWDECGEKPYLSMTFTDFYTNVQQKFDYLLQQDIKILIYNGDKDLICNWLSTEYWLNGLDWSDATGFANIPYTTWTLDGKDVAVYKKHANLAFFIIKDAGHMVPMDQPKVAYELLKDYLFTSFLHNITTYPEFFDTKLPNEFVTDNDFLVISK